MTFSFKLVRKMINSLILNAIYYLFLSEKNIPIHTSVENELLLDLSKWQRMNQHYFIKKKKKKTKMCPTGITDSVCQKV